MGDALTEATALKNKGNEAFKRQDWPAAVDFYTQAIAKYDKEPSFYTNRAQVCRRTACVACRSAHSVAGQHQARVVRAGSAGC
jgi:hypothetical protein